VFRRYPYNLCCFVCEAQTRALEEWLNVSEKNNKIIVLFLIFCQKRAADLYDYNFIRIPAFNELGTVITIFFIISNLILIGISTLSETGI